MLRALRLSCLALSLVSLAGCGGGSGDGPFDPRGDDVKLYGEWDVLGQDPASSEACAEAKIETVELVFHTLDLEESYTDADLRWPCDYGVYDSVAPVLRRGWYRYEWRAYEPSATTPTFTSKAYVMDAREVSSFDLMAVDFVREMAL